MTTTTYDSNTRLSNRVTRGAKALAQRLHAIGDYPLRYSVVLVLAWIGAMKFTAYDPSKAS